MPSITGNGLLTTSSIAATLKKFLGWLMLAEALSKRKDFNLKKLKYLALALALVSSLALNVATLAFSTVALALSAVFEAVTRMSAVASELRRNNAVNEKKIKSLTTDLEVKQRQTAKLSGELTQERRRVSTLSDDLATSKTKQQTADNTIAKNKGRIASLSDDLATSETKRKGLANDLTAKEKQVSSLTDELAVRDRRIASLSTTLKNPSVKYRNEMKPLSHAVEDTVGRITRRTTFGAKRNVASMFGESIPFVGVGVAVAVTGYELKDSCANLQDLRELEVSINPSLAYAVDVKEVCGMQVPTKDEIWTKASTSPLAAWEAAKGYTPSLENLQFPQVSFSGAWETAKDGGGDVWGATKDTANTMKLGWDYNMQMLKDAFDQSADPE